MIHRPLASRKDTDDALAFGSISQRILACFDAVDEMLKFRTKRISVLTKQNLFIVKVNSKTSFTLTKRD